MKKLLLLLTMTALTASLFAQQLSWRFANPRFIRLSGVDHLQFEVQVQCSQAGTYLWASQIKLVFNNTAFNNTASNWTVIRAGVFAGNNTQDNPKYTITKTITGNIPDKIYNIGITGDVNAQGNGGNEDDFGLVPTTWTTLVTVSARFITPVDDDWLAGIDFLESGMNGFQQHITTPNTYVLYENPNLFDAKEFLTSNSGRLYATNFGWSQIGGSTNGQQFNDWNTSVSTTVWEGSGVITQTNQVAALVENLTVLSGATLNVDALKQLTVSGTISNNGSLVVGSDVSGTGSLLHNTNNVPGTVQRYVTGNANLNLMDYHFVSVPITTGAVSGLFAGSYLYRFDAPTQDWAYIGPGATIPLNTLEGFMIYYPAPSTTYEYTGPLYNGPSSLEVSYHTVGGYSGMNLVPNPYPSAIDWNSATGWTKTNMLDAIWIWNPVLNNYATYGTYIGTNGATQFIPVGQAFFVKAGGAAPVLQVNNNARVHNGQAFFDDPNEGLIRIASVTEQSQDEIVVRLRETANESYDAIEDVEKLFGSPLSPQLYSLSTDEMNLAINTWQYPETATSIPVHFMLGANAPVALNISEVSSIPEQYAVLLEDLLTGTFTDLRVNTSYQFEHDTIFEADRFRLHLQNTLGDDELASGQFRLWSQRERVYFTIPASIGNKVVLNVRDMAGRQILEKEMILQQLNSFTIPNFNGIISVMVVEKEKIHQAKTLILW
ncbi:MAG: hypothetical protein Q8S18_01250 [Bacteroidales bacterium]|nr:hypothetical protein [Bacteroidales bacterium]